MSSWRVRLGAVAAFILMSGSAPAATVGYVDGIKNAEDLIPVPDTKWIVTGGLGDNQGPGGLSLIDTATLRARPLYPVPGNRIAHDRRAYPDCPGPLAPRGFSAHGVNLRPESNRSAVILAVNHVQREAVEVFRFDHRRAAPALTWIGCIPLPKGSIGNGVAPLPGGGIVVSLMNAPEYFPAGVDLFRNPQLWIPKLTRGETSGYVSTWRPGEGWRKVPGTEGSGSNGVEVSRDGRWVYVARWGNREIMRAPLGSGGEVSKVSVDFAPDNLRWGDDGNLWTAGAATGPAEYFACAGKRGCHSAWVLARIDPESLAITPVPHPDTGPMFAHATTAFKLGNRVWIGANPGERVAYLNLGK